MEGWDGVMEGIYSTGCAGRERARAPEKWCPFIPEAAKGSPWLVPEGGKTRKRCHSRGHGTTDHQGRT